MAKWDSDGLLIQTRSVEKVLAPLVAQMSLLVNNGIKDEKINGNSSQLIDSVLPNLELAICNFTSIGHEIGNVNSDIHDEMVDACDATNRACQMIVRTLSLKQGVKEHEQLVEACRLLTSAITRILILADKTAVRKLVGSLQKVDRRLEEIENVVNFKDFVHAFSQFGGDMVELAYISGERQNDLKDDTQRAEVCASRATLEKSTMMLLTTCKTCLRHPDSALATGNRNSVFDNMRNAMKVLKAIIENNEYPDQNISRAICLDIKDLEESLLLILEGKEEINEQFLERLDNLTIDMEDVINIEQISENKKFYIKASITAAKNLHKQLRRTVLEDGQEKFGEVNGMLSKLQLSMNEINRQLIEAALEQVEEILSDPLKRVALNQLKPASLSGDLKQVESIVELLQVESQTILEISKLVKNVSTNEACIITASRIEENLVILLPQLVGASEMLAGHPLSKITQENLEIFMDVWDTQVDELTSLLRNIMHAETTHGSH